MNQKELESMGKAAREAAYSLMKATAEEKKEALLHAADVLLAAQDRILAANARDLENAKKNGMSPAMTDRLSLTEARLKDMAQAIRDVADLPDPVGEILSENVRPNGLRIVKKRVPIGVVGIIYEARPNVTSDAFSIAFKSSNAVILKGGSDAIFSNAAVTDALRQALRESGMNPDALQLIGDTSHETAAAFMRMNEWVDVLIPRGSKRLIQAVVKNATVPVIETGAGNCHIFLDAGCDIAKAVNIVFNAKTQRIGVCNAAESLVVRAEELDRSLPEVAKKLQEKNVVIMADPRSYAALTAVPGLRKDLIFPASEEDFYTEYLDYKISVKTVDSTEEAIEHINRCSTHHSESIITENEEHAQAFLREIDSACVYWNASTRFTDGGCFGLGAEIGISTARLHARGPMGIRELTTMKYEIYGTGQVR